ncbi:MAG: monovalent cation/H+ antiporter subunit D family protein, partial [Coraliomargarita sp.]|nr:monovalent cation/H+ antiporter subunit D family protein [Coraliomargarita sp.]
IIGVGVKAGVMPFHSWLPAAMVAPTPVSALLHAVAVVKSGAFGVLRIVGFVVGPTLMAANGLDVLLACFASATILCASIIALRQDNLKKRLAYSTIGHLSYIVLGAALVTPAAFMGGVLHLSAHALMKITLFFCAGVVYVHTHRTEISSLNGLGRSMPWTFGAYTVGSLGLAGIPPINGFISKWWLAIGSMEAGHIAFLCVFLLSGILNAAYFFPIVIRGFFMKPAEGQEDAVSGEASLWMVIPLCLTALLAIVFGLLPNLPIAFFDLAKVVVDSVFDMGGVSPQPN